MYHVAVRLPPRAPAGARGLKGLARRVEGRVPKMLHTKGGSFCFKKIQIIVRHTCICIARAVCYIHGPPPYFASSRRVQLEHAREHVELREVGVRDHAPA